MQEDQEEVIAAYEFDDNDLDSLILGDSYSVLKSIKDTEVSMSEDTIPAPLDQALQKELEELAKLWQWESVINFGAGYTSNALSSYFAEEESWFLKSSIETFAASNPLKSKNRFLVYLYLENKRHLHLREMDDESFGVIQGKWSRSLFDVWDISLDFKGQYLNQVLDLSSDEDLNINTPIEAVSPEFTASLKRFFSRKFYLQLEGGWKETRFNLDSEDYSSPAIGLESSLSLGERGSKLSIEWMYQEKEFDERFNPVWDEDDLNYLEHFGFWPTPSSYGRLEDIGDPSKPPPISLDYQLQTVTLNYLHYWNDKKSLTTKTRVRYLKNEDNKWGYYDYSSMQWTQRFQWNHKKWTFELKLGLALKNYEGQGVVLPDENDLRYIESLDTSLKVEYDYSEHISFTSEFSWDDDQSNNIEDNISTTSATLGLEWRY